MSSTTQPIITSLSSLGQDPEWSKKAQVVIQLIVESIERLSEKSPSHACEARKWKSSIEREHDLMVANLQNLERLGRETLERYNTELTQLQEREAQFTAKEQAANSYFNAANEAAADLKLTKKTIYSKSKEVEELTRRGLELTSLCSAAVNTRMDAMEKFQTLKEQSESLNKRMDEENVNMDQRKSGLDTAEEQLGIREAALAEAKKSFEAQSRNLRREKEEFQREKQSYCNEREESRGLLKMAVEYKNLKDQDIEAIKTRVPMLEQDNYRLQAEEKFLKTSNEELLSKTKALDDAVKILNAESLERASIIESLQDRLVKMEAASKRAQQSCEKEHGGIIYLRQELDSVKDDRDEILKRGRRLQDASNKKAKDLEAAYSKELDEGRRNYNRLSMRLTGCQEQLDTSMEKHVDLVEENRTLKENYLNSQAQATEVRRKLELSLNESKEEIGRITDKSNLDLITRNTLDTKLSIAQDKIRDLTRSIDKIKSEHAKVSQELRTSNESLESVRGENGSIAQELQAANQDRVSLRAEFTRASQELRIANQRLGSCRCSKGQDNPRKRARTPVNESERTASSHSGGNQESRIQYGRKSSNALLEISRQQGDGRPDGSSPTDPTTSTRIPLRGPTITSSREGHFFMPVSDVEGNCYTSDIIPGQVLARIRQQVGIWTKRDPNWTKRSWVPSRCVAERLRHRANDWADGVDYACNWCRTNGHVCSLLDKQGLLRFLPLKLSGETTKAPGDVEYWVERSLKLNRKDS